LFCVMQNEKCKMKNEKWGMRLRAVVMRDA
jgi:hypothetical protein